jgi:patatin-like phospholipase/acyl hydrolase
MLNRFQILSLDGGGIKGIFSAAVLTHLEEDLNLDIAEHFDLITGTSTGGIIAIGLGRGMRPREILSFYVDKGPGIFANSLMTSLILLCHFPTADLPSILRAVYDRLSQLQIDVFCGEFPFAEKLHPL